MSSLYSFDNKDLDFPYFSFESWLLNNFLVAEYNLEFLTFWLLVLLYLEQLLVDLAALE